jgi:hypothetical protein
MVINSNDNELVFPAATAYLTQNANIPGGMLQPHINSLKYCWKACVYSFECKGFDYDTHYGTCWLHTQTSICMVLVHKPYVNNYRLVHCRKSYYVQIDWSTDNMQQHIDWPTAVGYLIKVLTISYAIRHS